MAAKAAPKAKKLYTATVYALDGTVTTYTEPKAFFSLRWLQAQVGGSIETAPAGKGLAAVVNENGLNLGLPTNAAYAAHVRTLPAQSRPMSDFCALAGPVVVLPMSVLWRPSPLRKF